MKKLLLILAALVLLPVLSWAADKDITFAWDANTEPDLAGYRIYQSATKGQYTYGDISPQKVADILVTETTKMVRVLPGNWYWVITAFDSGGLESGPSNELTIAPSAPTTFRITVIVEMVVP